MKGSRRSYVCRFVIAAEAGCRHDCYMSGEEQQRRPVEGEKRLIARLELDQGVSISLHEASLPLTIGRGADCDICISRPNVSRLHCELDLVGGELYLKDTSTNGTTIDNRPVRQASVPILARTSFLLANEVMLTVTPLERTHSNDGSEKIPERRRAERRQGGDRRQTVIAVNFERRRSDGRRVKDRRAASRS